MRSLTKFVVPLAVAALAPAAAQAQTTASDNINAVANVLGAIAVTGQADLDFGDLLPGGAGRTVLPSDAASGEYLVTGSANAEVSLDFVFPATIGDGLGNTLPVNSFAAAVGADRATAVGVTVPSGLSNIAASGSMNVYVGATVGAPPAAQVPGVYTGTIQLTATYTGN